MFRYLVTFNVVTVEEDGLDSTVGQVMTVVEGITPEHAISQASFFLTPLDKAYPYWDLELHSVTTVDEVKKGGE